MNSFRNLGTALIYAVISIVLVVGGLSLALAEGGLNAPQPTAHPSPTLFASSVPATQPDPSTPLPASSTPQIVYVTATQPVAGTPAMVLPSASPQPSATSTARSYYSATPVRCGPYSGWVRNYVVQQGDTLYHIATQYQTTVPALQTANCLSNTLIVPGQRLWVPNVATITPGVTAFPTFPSSTPAPTEPLTLTPIPFFTETAVPTFTDTPVTPNP